MFLTDKISEESYSQLRQEWREKVKHAEANLRDVKHHLTRYLNDLDIALILLTKVSNLYLRVDEKKRAILLQILVKRIIVNSQGEIFNHELHSPFAYLRSLVDDFQNLVLCGSDHVRSGSSTPTHPEPHTIAVEQFFEILRFENRSKLAELPDELVKG